MGGIINNSPVILLEVQSFNFRIVPYSIITLLLQLSSKRGADIKVKGLYFDSITLFYLNPFKN
jgi:hypothetical protein